MKAARQLPRECYPPMTWAMVAHAARPPQYPPMLVVMDERGQFTEELFTKITEKIKRGEK